jgi:hypothetical protein
MEMTLEGILDHGVTLVREKGNDGLHEFLGRFDAWYEERRRKGRQGWLRPFLDWLAYECKVSFYLCYANTWIDLIPWLQRHRGLDAVSERFLRFWHMQNGPVRLPDGRIIPAVFRGQVLSLHPLSGFFMKDPALCAVAGRYFGSDAYDRVTVQGRAADCAEYWDLIGAVLTAAGLYRQALDEQRQNRGVRLRHGDGPGPGRTAPEERSPAGMLEEFAASRGLRCAACGGALRFQTFRAADAEAEGFDAEFTCGACGLPARPHFARDDLIRHLGVTP